MIQRIAFLVRHEARMEFRQQHTLIGIALFALSTVYLCYQAFQKIEQGKVWSSLLWIIILFTAFSAIGKSFQQQQRGLRLYLYWTVSPGEFILAKVVYNMGLMLLLGFLAFGAFVLFLGSAPFESTMWGPYLLGVGLGSIGFASLLTLVSGIAAQSESGVGLTAVLGIPIVIPLILLLNRYNENILVNVPFSENVQNLGFLGVLTLGILGLSYILFPYLWRD